MKLVFVDEVEQPHKNADFFGVGALIIDSNFYRGLRAGVEKALKDAGWNLQMEFKGRYLFSSSQGDTWVSVENRIGLVKKIVANTTATKNARARFCFAYNLNGRSGDNYLGLVAKSLGRCPKSTTEKGDKNLVVVYYDGQVVHSGGARSGGRPSGAASPPRSIAPPLTALFDAGREVKEKGTPELNGFPQR